MLCPKWNPLLFQRFRAHCGRGGKGWWWVTPWMMSSDPASLMAHTRPLQAQASSNPAWSGRVENLTCSQVLAVRKGGVEFSVCIPQWLMCTSVEDQKIRDDLGIPNWKTEDKKFSGWGSGWSTWESRGGSDQNILRKILGANKNIKWNISESNEILKIIGPAQ